MQDYTGLAVLGWLPDPLDRPGPDFPFFLRSLRTIQDQCWDVGCGSGWLLTPFIEHSVDVESTDSVSQANV